MWHCVCCCVRVRRGTIKLLREQLDLITKGNKAHFGIKQLLQLHHMLTGGIAAADMTCSTTR